MSDKFHNKYRIPSARLRNWNYGSNALYFVTICTQDREHYFGEIEDDKMILSETGKMAQEYWMEIPLHFPFVELDEFVIMPNHVHGIIVIDKPVDGGRDDDGTVETQNFASLPGTTGNKFGPQSKNLASIVRGFKIGVTKFARSNGLIFSWQPRYHDHIIRNDASFQRISDYIKNNPSGWTNDKFFNP
jgi:REP element-mobilizing transposase RayT